MVAVINGDTYPFLALQGLTCHMPPDDMETELGSSDEEASPSTG